MKRRNARASNKSGKPILITCVFCGRLSGPYMSDCCRDCFEARESRVLRQREPEIFEAGIPNPPLGRRRRRAS